MIMGAEFVDKLPPQRDTAQVRARKLLLFADELIENSGRWAKYPMPLNEPYAAAVRINKGAPAWCSKGRFEAAVRDGKVYVRAVKKR